MITPIGTLTVGDTLPGAVTLSAEGTAGIALAIPDLEARIAALASFSPQPFSFAAALTLAQQTVLSIQTSITLGLPVPSLDAQIAAVLALVAALEASLAAVEVHASAITSLSASFSVGGVELYAYAGNKEDLGPEFASLFAGDATPVNALVMVTSTPAAWTALGTMVRTS